MNPFPGIIDGIDMFKLELVNEQGSIHNYQSPVQHFLINREMHKDGDEITSPIIHHSFRPSLSDLPDEKIDTK